MELTSYRSNCWHRVAISDAHARKRLEYQSQGGSHGVRSYFVHRGGSQGPVCTGLESQCVSLVTGRHSQGSPLPWVATPRGRHSQRSLLPECDAVLLSCDAVLMYSPSRTLHHPANPLYSIIILSHPFSTPGHFSSHVFQPSHRPISYCTMSLE